MKEGKKYTRQHFFCSSLILCIRYDDTYKYVDCTYVESYCRCFLSCRSFYFFLYISHTSNLIIFSSHFSPWRLFLPVYLISSIVFSEWQIIQPRTDKLFSSWQSWSWLLFLFTRQNKKKIIFYLHFFFEFFFLLFTRTRKNSIRKKMAQVEEKLTIN